MEPEVSGIIQWPGEALDASPPTVDASTADDRVSQPPVADSIRHQLSEFIQKVEEGTFEGLSTETDANIREQQRQEQVNDSTIAEGTMIPTPKLQQRELQSPYDALQSNFNRGPVLPDESCVRGPTGTVLQQRVAEELHGLGDLREQGDDSEILYQHMEGSTDSPPRYTVTAPSEGSDDHHQVTEGQALGVDSGFGTEIDDNESSTEDMEIEEDYDASDDSGSSVSSLGSVVYPGVRSVEEHLQLNLDLARQLLEDIRGGITELKQLSYKTAPKLQLEITSGILLLAFANGLFIGATLCFFILK